MAVYDEPAYAMNVTVTSLAKEQLLPAEWHQQMSFSDRIKGAVGKY